MNILLVCTGNTCRSSMAEGIFKQMLIDLNIENINVSSAGLSAFEGDKANQKSIDVLKNKGIDISKHSARQLTGEIIKRSDLILTMTAAHKMSILNYAPHSK
ncbi:MAG: protein tyrosine phosphatase, partial [Sedimentibacter sp.]|nr:protein tyrosine phosphatase [Sedimentibacter sp.]